MIEREKQAVPSSLVFLYMHHTPRAPNSRSRESATTLNARASYATDTATNSKAMDRQLGNPKPAAGYVRLRRLTRDEEMSSMPCYKLSTRSKQLSPGARHLE